MTTAQRVLDLARAEIGYNRWDDPAEGTKYGRWFAKMGMGSYFGTSGVPYCNMFTSYVLNAAGVAEPSPGRFAYVPYCINAYRAAGRGVAVRDAQPGDLICFDWDGDGVADHIGFVEANRGGYVQTIEGNTSGSANGSQANGGGVYRRTRSWDGVIAVMRPAYQAAANPAPAAPSSKPPKLGVDEYFGPDTQKAWARINGTTPDGVVSSQDIHWKPSYGDRITCAEWVPTERAEGSSLIAQVQTAFKRAGLYDGDIDGLIGPKFIAAFIAYYGGGNLPRAIGNLQRAINRQNGH